MATTLSGLLSLPSAWPNLKSVSLDSSSVHLRRLGELSAQHPDLAPQLTREMALRAVTYMRGVKLYKQHAVRRERETTPTLWQSGTTLLRDYAPDLHEAPIVFVVPSLINRFTILDLHRDHSFLQTLRKRGLRPLVVDWNRPGDDEKNFALDDYITERLVPALKIASAERPVHILGYCMGGLLALALANLCAEHTRTLALLATPWDFHAGYNALGQDGARIEQSLKTWLSQEEPLPVDVVHNVFTSMQPLHAFRKFSTFTSYDQNGFDAARFVLTEDWLNDGVPLTASAARQCFGDWCARNAAASSRWTIHGRTVGPETVDIPSYVVIPGRDHIVPPEAARPLAQGLRQVTCSEPEMGHIGIMASPSASAQVWLPLAAWLEAH